MPQVQGARQRSQQAGRPPDAILGLRAVIGQQLPDHRGQCEEPEHITPQKKPGKQIPDYAHRPVDESERSEEQREHKRRPSRPATPQAAMDILPQRGETRTDRDWLPQQQRQPRRHPEC
jgi:hypothetical protein